MTDQQQQLRARYRTRFLDSARDRVERSLELVAGRAVEDAASLAQEFRSLAGEAQMLGLERLAAVARVGEDAARLWEEEGSLSAIGVCEGSLATIADTLQMFGQMNTGDFSARAQAVMAERGTATAADDDLS